MKKEEIFCNLFGFTKNTYYVWKRENKPIILLLNIYFSKNELEKYIKTKNITKLSVINGYEKEKEITNILNIIKLHNNINIDADYFDENGQEIEQEEVFEEDIARFIAFLSINKHDLNTFNAIDLDVQFQLFNEIYPHKNNIKLLNELKMMRYMLPDTIVACKEYAENDFLELFEDKKIAKKIEKRDIYYFFIPFLIFKYMGILIQLDAKMIFEKRQFFKDNDYSNGIKMLVNDLKDHIHNNVRALEKKKEEKTLTLNKDEWENFEKELDNPKPASKELKELMNMKPIKTKTTKRT